MGGGSGKRLGARYGEIPLFKPGAGSAASAGVTEVRAWEWWSWGRRCGGADTLQTPALGSVAPDLFWGPNGGGRRHVVPGCLANAASRSLRTLAPRTGLGLGPKSSLGRRVLGRCEGSEVGRV